MLWDIWYAFKNFGIACGVFLREVSRPFGEHFSFRHVLCVQGMLKLTFLYSACIVWIILLDFRLPDKFDRANTTVAIYYTHERIGERLLADHVITAAKSNGWQVLEASFPESMTNYSITRHFYEVAASLMNIIYQPTFNLAVTHYVLVVPYGYNITYLNVPNEMLFSMDGHFKSRWEHLADYDAYIDLHSVANGNNLLLAKELARLKKSHNLVIPLYLAMPYADYSPARRDEILIIGGLWGCNRGSSHVKLALKRLADEKTLVAYGIKGYFEFLGDGYKGYLEDYGGEVGGGSRIEALMLLQKRYGIALVIHNLTHMIEQIPTNRISEAVMAGSIVISDNNGFVKKFFGDNVLYIDSIAQSDEVYAQVKSHVEWIRSHPHEAERKAKAAYDILVKEFALEESLKKLLDKVLDDQRQKHSSEFQSRQE